MLGNVRSDAVGVPMARAGAQPQSAQSATGPVQPQAGRRGQEADADQLRLFLSNITRADAAAVIALTQPPRGEASASYDAVASAYCEV
ncbi:hypothetical protein [Mesorhizobium australicum]|uniref:Uncharacterized protein n=1 Tax=Mesorhizobium australicum TaxID=536018 RepID=A0A1X7PZN2_9HYPH|nr:hypothetical protein [Mesorhizobium australicum]SMH57198.1 hypothetical protein SAMN02982922_5708 [Mesorhizobium australicum]